MNSIKVQLTVEKAIQGKTFYCFFNPLEIEQTFCYDSKHEIKKEKEKVVEE